MTIQTLYTAATGMEAMQTKLEVIANNLANVNTTAFKRDRANFEDLLYRNDVLPGALDSSGQPNSTGIATGLGTRVSSTQTNFTQGSPGEGGELDMLIQGEGFFQVINPANGDTLYTRAGNFDVNASGQIVLSSAGNGYLLDPAVTLPDDRTGVSIGQDGRVSVRQAGTNVIQELTQLTLARFVNPQGLLKLGENLYAETPSSGTATTGTPGQAGFGAIQQNYLELSNVEPVQELIDLITTQRSFELNSQTVQAGDEMLQVVSNLRR